MAVNGNFLKLYSMIGVHRNILSSRIILPIYQPVALKRTLEERAGLPPRPKKPGSAYLEFSKTLRPSLMQKYPQHNVIEITKSIAKEWQKADQKLKDELKKEYQKVIEEWRVAKAKYEAALTPEDKRKVEILKLQMLNTKKKKIQTQTLKDLGKPRRPGSAFAMWCATLGSKRGTISLAEWQRVLIKKWEALPPKEKGVFEVKAAAAMKAFIIENKNWTDKMLSSNNNDLSESENDKKKLPDEQQKASK